MVLSEGAVGICYEFVGFPSNHRLFDAADVLREELLPELLQRVLVGDCLPLCYLEPRDWELEVIQPLEQGLALVADESFYPPLQDFDSGGIVREVVLFYVVDQGLSSKLAVSA